MKRSPDMRRAEPIFCYACQKKITGARTVIEGQYHCSDCTYAHDYPDKVIPERVPRKRAKPYEGPTLFEPTGYLKVKEQQSRPDER